MSLGGDVFSLIHTKGERILAGLSNGDFLMIFLAQVDAYTVADVLLPEAPFKRLQKSKALTLPFLEWFGGVSPLHAAALLDKAGVAHTLIENAGCALWLHDAYGKTALDYAIKYRNYSTVQVLVDAAAHRPEETALAFTTNGRLFELLADLAVIGKEHIGQLVAL